MENEVWKEIVGFADYEVSDLGRVRSYKRGKNGAMLKPRRHKKGINIGLFICWGMMTNIAL